MAEKPTSDIPSSHKMTRPPVVLVVACSARKRLPVHPTLALGSITAKNLVGRSRTWRVRLEGTDAPTAPARDLYIGDHWSAVRRAHARLRSWNSGSELWVISAGYGLVSADKPIKAYSATFASGQPDSVWRGEADGVRPEALQAWWGSLPHETSLSQLVASRGNPVVLVVAGSAYMDALAHDLGHVTSAGHNERFFTICAGKPTGVAALSVKAQDSTTLGGTLSAVNARTLALLVDTAEEHRFRRDEMEAVLDRTRDKVPPKRLSPRMTLGDDELAAAIHSIRSARPTISRTLGLRSLRASGIACEQSRFGRIWRGQDPELSRK